MTLYIVRHKATGHELPQLIGRGYSSWDQDHPDPACNWGPALTPRLFHSLPAAKSFIGQWLRGIASNDGDYGITILPQAHRSREQLEIVPVELQYGEPL